MSMLTAPSHIAGMPHVLTRTRVGISWPIARLRPGMYIWHEGAFRLVSGVDAGRRIVKMADGHVLHSMNAATVEAA